MILPFVASLAKPDGGRFDGVSRKIRVWRRSGARTRRKRFWTTNSVMRSVIRPTFFRYKRGGFRLSSSVSYIVNTVSC